MSDNLIGATTAIFIVSLSIAVAEPVDVAWSTRDGTAKAGTDYQAANGVVTFLPGETEKQIEVIVYGQNVSPTGDKNFFINLTPPTNAVLGTALIEAVIKVEDEAGVPVTSVIVAQGKRGLKGDPGLSAYEQAVLMGYEGTLEDWMQEQANAAAAAQRASDYAANAAAAATKAENAATAASFLGNIFPTPEAGVDPVTGVQNGAYYNVRSPDDDSYLVEYQNIGGVPTPSGKSYPSSAYVQNLSERVDDVSGYVPLPFVPGKEYAIGERVTLSNGDIVKPTVPNNTVNPNVDMTGWVNTLDLRNIDKNIVITVGATSQYQTINAALEYLSRFKKVFTSVDITAEILIKSGFIAQEQINCEGLDLSWITISSEDAEVIVDRASLLVQVGRWYSFMRFRNSKAPIINTLFSMNTNGSASLKTNCYLIHSEMWVSPGKGFKNAGERNVDITQCSTFVGASGIFTGAGAIGVRPATGSRAFLQFADFSDSTNGMSCGTSASVAANDVLARNCAVTAVEVQGGVTIELNGADLSGSGTFGLLARGKCNVNANAANMSNSAGVGVYAEDGASLDLTSAIVNNCAGDAGILAIDGATISGNRITATGNKVNLRATKGATIATDVATLTGASIIGLFASEGGKIVATNSNYRKGASDSASDAQVLASGEIILNGSTGGTSQSPDVHTPNGVLRKSNRVASRGSASISAGQTSVTVTHLMSGVPVVVATPRANLGSNQYWISSVDATSFVISVATAVTSNTNFFWVGELS